MEISVLVQAVDSRGYRATSLDPTRLVAEGDTREKALDALSKLVQREFSNGEVVRLKVPLPGEQRARKSFAGIWKNHPDIDDVVQNIQEYRRQVDSDPERS